MATKFAGSGWARGLLGGAVILGQISPAFASASPASKVYTIQLSIPGVARTTLFDQTRAHVVGILQELNCAVPGTERNELPFSQWACEFNNGQYLAAQRTFARMNRELGENGSVALVEFDASEDGLGPVFDRTPVETSFAALSGENFPELTADDIDGDRFFDGGTGGGRDAVSAFAGAGSGGRTQGFSQAAYLPRAESGVSPRTVSPIPAPDSTSLPSVTATGTNALGQRALALARDYVSSDAYHELMRTVSGWLPPATPSLANVLPGAEIVSHCQTLVSETLGFPVRRESFGNVPAYAVREIRTAVGDDRIANAMIALAEAEGGVSAGRSGANARGFLQVTVETARRECGINAAQLAERARNIACAQRVFRNRLEAAGGDIVLAWGVYNTTPEWQRKIARSRRIAPLENSAGVVRVNIRETIRHVTRAAYRYYQLTGDANYNPGSASFRRRYFVAPLPPLGPGELEGSAARIALAEQLRISSAQALAISEGSFNDLQRWDSNEGVSNAIVTVERVPEVEGPRPIMVASSR